MAFNRKFINTVLLAAATAFAWRCGTAPEDRIIVPANIIPRDKMALILVDFALAESATALNIKNAPINRLDTVYAFNPLADHGIRRSQYDSSINFYSSHPELYKPIYDTVLAKLSALQVAREKIVRDSTAR